MIIRISTTLLLLFIVNFTIQGQDVNVENQYPKVDDPYPRGLDKGLLLNMSLEGFLNRYDDVELIEDNNFRIVYKVIPYLRDIPEIYLYFDKDDERQPLYEMIFLFHETERAKETAIELYGSPNYDGTEWRMEHRYIKLWSWIYKNKIVLVGNAYNSDNEWTSSFN